MRSRYRSKSFKRNKSQKSPGKRRSVLLVCEGEGTEPDYFRTLRKQYRLKSFTLEFLFPGGPTSIAQEAVNKKHRYDYVWAVFDRDEHSGYHQAIRRCQGAGVGVAYSNPCFELWLILHVTEMDRLLNRHAMQSLCREHIQYPPNENKRPDYYWLMQERRVETAKERAAAQLKKRFEEGAVQGNPSTTVGELTKWLRQLEISQASPESGAPYLDIFPK